MEKQKLKDLFKEEVYNHIDQFEQALVNIEKDYDQIENINSIFRTVHTVKSSSALVGLNDLSDFCHRLENVLQKVRGGEMPFTYQLLNLLYESLSIIKNSLHYVDNPQSYQISDSERVVNSKIFEYLSDELPKQTNSPTIEKTKKNTFQWIYHLKIGFNEDSFINNIDIGFFIDELTQLGEIESIKALMNKEIKLEETDPKKLYLFWECNVKTDVDESEILNVFVFLEQSQYFIEIEKKEKIVPNHEPPPNDSITHPIELFNSTAQKTNFEEQGSGDQANIRVDTRKLDHLVDLVSEAVIEISKLEQIVQDRQLDKIQSLRQVTDNLHRFSKDLRQQVMKLRMIPIRTTFNRFYRIVRSIGMELKKKIMVEIEGIDTELDKTMIEKISDPLKHLIRNSVDHGIEEPEERIKKNKTAEGKIRLAAIQKEGKIVLEVADDGKGLDKEEIYQKAIAKNFIESNKDLTEEEIFNLIFLPGFSTSKKVTPISGRGVGLDVVKQNISDLKGTIQIESKRNRGVLFRITLPLTLAIMDGMIVKIGCEYLTLPIHSIIETIKIKKSNLKLLQGGNEMIELRDDYVPLFRLYQLFNFVPLNPEPDQGLIIIIEGNKKKFALLVDEIVGEQQVVIKNVEKNFQYIPGTSGVTILGDGNLSFIIDIIGIEKLAFNQFNQLGVLFP